MKKALLLLILLSLIITSCAPKNVRAATIPATPELTCQTATEYFVIEYLFFHIWDGLNIVADVEVDGTVIDTYIRGGGLIRSWVHGYYIFNARGDVV